MNFFVFYIETNNACNYLTFRFDFATQKKIMQYLLNTEKSIEKLINCDINEWQFKLKIAKLKLSEIGF